MAYVADPKLTDPNESASTDERRGIASTSDPASGYWEWSFSGEAENHHYLVPGVLKALPRDRGERVLDIGCGNGALSAKIARSGFSVTGIDVTPSGIDRAKQSYPDVTFLPHDITLPLPEGLRNQFDIVVSCEVIEHLFLPRDLFARAREALGAWVRTQFGQPKPLICSSYLSTSGVSAALRRFCGEDVLIPESASRF